MKNYMGTESQEKSNEYAVALMSAIGELFEENSDYHIDTKEFSEGDNLTHFINALANVVPTAIYNDFTGDSKNYLEFNHIANRLVFQYSIREVEQKKVFKVADLKALLKSVDVDITFSRMVEILNEKAYSESSENGNGGN